MNSLSLFLITAVIGILVAAVLVYLASSISKPKSYLNRKWEKDHIPPSSISDKGLKKIISNEISGLVPSENQRKKLSEKMSYFFNDEMQRRLDVNTQTLSKKHALIIKDKEQHETLITKKYFKTLGEKKETDAVIRSMAEGLLVIDDKGKVIMLNPAAEKLLNVSKETQIGQDISKNLKNEHLLSLVKDSPEKKSKEIEFLNQDDETKKVLRSSSAVIEDENGKTIGMVSMLSDITKQKELDQMKANFVAKVSHELRTPLVATEKSISLLLTKAPGSINETQEQFLAIAQRNLKRLSRLINDLLDLSKLEAHKMSLEKKPSSMEEIIDDSMETFKTWAGTKSINIEKKIDKNLPLVNIDPSKMIQVINNLLGNAIKFTPPNGIITVETKFQEETQELKINVADTGLGIPEEDLSKVFTKFYQTKDRGSTDISGTGLGLSIVKEIIELHNGRIWVESEKGTGANFIFTLPLTNELNNGG